MNYDGTWLSLQDGEGASRGCAPDGCDSEVARSSSLHQVGDAGDAKVAADRGAKEVDAVRHARPAVATAVPGDFIASRALRAVNQFPDLPAGEVVDADVHALQ